MHACGANSSRYGSGTFPLQLDAFLETIPRGVRASLASILIDLSFLLILRVPDPGTACGTFTPINVVSLE